jgi:type VI secretion system protein ImpC
MLGCYRFGPDDNSVALLERIAMIAAQARAPWISGATPLFLGLPALDSEVETELPREISNPSWTAFRKRSEARSLALTIPRFLLRAPYGKNDEPCESFDFEESEDLGSPLAHEHYLWGNSALLCALDIGQSFQEMGWELRPGRHREVDGLPVHVTGSGAASRAKPCAETVLLEKVGERILGEGLIPVASSKRGDSVLLLSLQSAALPSAPLAGRWSGTAPV